MRSWVNGVMSEPGRAMVRGDDAGFLLGDGVFETIRVADGRPVFLTRHLDRLARGLRSLDLGVPDRERVLEGVSAVCALVRDPLARMRITVSSGAGPQGYARPTGGPTVVVAARAVSRSSAAIDLVSATWPRNPSSPATGVKSLSQVENVLAVQRARRAGAHDALFTDDRGRLSETATSNLFYVAGGELRTPPLSTGCLPGVCRAVLLELAPDVREIAEPAEVLHDADEVFLTSALRGVVVVRSIDGLAVPGGPVGGTLADLVAAAASRETAALDRR